MPRGTGTQTQGMRQCYPAAFAQARPLRRPGEDASMQRARAAQRVVLFAVAAFGVQGASAALAGSPLATTVAVVTDSSITQAGVTAPDTAGAAAEAAAL